MSKLPKYVRMALVLLRERVNYENAAFSFTEDECMYMAQDAAISSMPDHTKQVKEVTRLYRNSWVNPIIDELLRGEQPVVTHRDFVDEAEDALRRWEHDEADN